MQQELVQLNESNQENLMLFYKNGKWVSNKTNPTTPIPANEAARLSALKTYDILDTPEEAIFDYFTWQASETCEAPIALISLVDSNRQWFKSKLGLTMCETSRDTAFCAHTICGNEILEVPNALEDERFRENALVKGPPNIRFYAGMPLINQDGFKLGALCVIDHVPRRLTLEQRSALHRLGRRVVGQLELRRSSEQRKQAEIALRLSEAKARAVFDQTFEFIGLLDLKGNVLEANQAALKFADIALEAVLGKPFWVTPWWTHSTILQQRLREAIREAGSGKFVRFETTHQAKDGSLHTVDFSLKPVHSADGHIVWLLPEGRDVTEEKRLQQELMESSRMAGMADVANNLLHNLGDVLNSINVSSSVILDQIKQSRIDLVEKAAAMLNQRQASMDTSTTTDAQGLQLPIFLKQLAQQLENERTSNLDEFEVLRNNIEHLKNIVASHQAYATASRTAESVDMTKLIDDALRINAATLARRNFQVIREYQKNLPEIFLVKHKTLEILVNLIRNATQACDESGHTEKRLHIHVTSDQKKIQVEITDNGSGIPAGNLSRLFHLGFSTKKQGHGFGLHRAAVAAKELGGTLSAQSEGPGKGATFKLELPKESCLNNTNVIGDFAEAGAN